MDTQTILALFETADAHILAGAALACVVTALVKRFLLNKIKIDLENSFDPSALLPFAAGLVFSALFAWIGGKKEAAVVFDILKEGLIIGALSTVIYKFYSSLDGKSLKQLLKDGFFALFYNGLMEYTDAAAKLKSGEMKLTDFIGQVQTLAANAKNICQSGSGNEERLENLKTLMRGIFSEETIEKLAPLLIQALCNLLAE